MEADDDVGAASIVSPTPVRPEMVATAVKFLTNPKIGSSTIAQKTAFLKDKGLGQSEIEAAMAQARLSAPAGTLSTSNGGLYTPAAVNIGRVPGDGEGQGEQPAWGWKEYFIAATVMTGAVVVAKDYVLPKLQGLFGGGSAEKLDEMNTSMAELKEEAAERNVKLEKLLEALTEKLDNVEGTLKSQSTDMRSVRGEVARNTTNMSKISEDVQTVKSLHLNPRNNKFPVPRTEFSAVTPSRSLSIPAWQRPSASAAGTTASASSTARSAAPTSVSGVAPPVPTPIQSTTSSPTAFSAAGQFPVVAPASSGAGSSSSANGSNNAAPLANSRLVPSPTSLPAQTDNSILPTVAAHVPAVEASTPLQVQEVGGDGTSTAVPAVAGSNDF